MNNKIQYWWITDFQNLHLRIYTHTFHFFLCYCDLVMTDATHILYDYIYVFGMQMICVHHCKTKQNATQYVEGLVCQKQLPRTCICNYTHRYYEMRLLMHVSDACFFLASCHISWNTLHIFAVLITHEILFLYFACWPNVTWTACLHLAIIFHCGFCMIPILYHITILHHISSKIHKLEYICVLLNHITNQDLYDLFNISWTSLLALMVGLEC